jgi:hypothetical protein
LHLPSTKSNGFLLKHSKCPSLIHLSPGSIKVTPKIGTKMLAVMLDLWKKTEQTLMADNNKLDAKLKESQKVKKNLSYKF